MFVPAEQHMASLVAWLRKQKRSHGRCPGCDSHHHGASGQEIDAHIDRLSGRHVVAGESYGFPFHHQRLLTPERAAAWQREQRARNEAR
jgi:hypothetical protein